MHFAHPSVCLSKVTFIDIMLIYDYNFTLFVPCNRPLKPLSPYGLRNNLHLMGIKRKMSLLFFILKNNTE